MSQPQSTPAGNAPLVVFDFDHTLYNGDSGSHLYWWLICRKWWRVLLALLLAPIAGPLVAFLSTRRAGISMFTWAGTVGLNGPRDVELLTACYVALHAAAIKQRLLPIGLEVFRRHREAGDCVVLATGAPPALARAILTLAGQGDVPVIGTVLGPGHGGMVVQQHCHYAMKMTMLRAAGYTQQVAAAYSDSSADLPLLQAAQQPVVVNPKAGRVVMFRRVLPAGTPILNWGCPGRAGDLMGVA
jgi:phosphatidylglycerophosphatase C